MGVRPAAPRVTVVMLTTAGATVSATWEKLPEGTGSAAGTIGPCTPIRVGFGYGGVARSTAPAPHVPRPAPTTIAIRRRKTSVLRLSEIIDDPPPDRPRGAGGADRLPVSRAV